MHWAESKIQEKKDWAIKLQHNIVTSPYQETVIADPRSNSPTAHGARILEPRIVQVPWIVTCDSEIRAKHLVSPLPASVSLNHKRMRFGWSKVYFLGELMEGWEWDGGNKRVSGDGRRTRGSQTATLFIVLGSRMFAILSLWLSFFSLWVVEAHK